METQAQVMARLDSEAVIDGDTETLPVELTAIPGAIWQTELQSLMPADVRVSLFQRGSQKCALLRFPVGGAEGAYRAFEVACHAANEVSQQAHSSAQSSARCSPQ